MSAKARSFQHTCRLRLQLSRTNGPLISTPSRKLHQQRAPQNGPARSNSSGITRRAVTVTSDDGRYTWSELSTGEKAARTTQQSFNFVLVTAGAVATIAVTYLLYTELFAADSKTRQFNRAVDRIKAEPKVRELLGPSNQITAYGEPTSNKWARARPLAHSVNIDKYGVTHFKMHFYVEGPEATGQVQVHMTKRQEQDELEYKLLSLTVPGHQTIYLENTDAQGGKKNLTRMFGVQWGK